MARTPAAPKQPTVPAVSMENPTYVLEVIDGGDALVSTLNLSKVAAFEAELAFTIAAHDRFRPLYDVVVAAEQSTKANAKVSAADFRGRLIERGRALKNDPTYNLAITADQMATALYWKGDAAEHEALQPLYDNVCANLNKVPTFSHYVSFLRKHRDEKGSHYNADGTPSARALELAKQAAQTATAHLSQRWCSIDVDENLDGMSPALSVAFLDALAHDIAAKRVAILTAAGSDETAVKKEAAKYLRTMVDLKQPIGPLATAIEA